MKTLEQINQEFFSELSVVRTEEASIGIKTEDPAEPDSFDPSFVCSLEDMQKYIGSPSVNVPEEEPEEELAAEPEEEHEAIPEEAGIEPEELTPADQKHYCNNKAGLKKFSDILFYVIIAFILIVTLVFGGKTHDGFHLFGYSGFTVLSGSMQREIPEGSLVITKAVEPETIEIGDDITFVRDDNATVTHRVVDIIEDYAGNGSRGFQTQGLENPEPDRDIVYADNIIGMVKYSVPELGFALSYASDNLGIVFIIFGGILAATIAFGKFLMH